jgi:hypothetical protein
MFTKLCALIIVGFLYCSLAYAGGRGGHSTTFDPNLYGGGWKNILDFNGACDLAAHDAWIAYGVALNPAQAKLYIPPGTICNWPGCGNLTNSCISGNPGIQNAIVWAYGASFTSPIRIGAWTFFNDGIHSARINSANVGDSSVVLITPGDAAKFSVGSWVNVNGLELQFGGFPGNWQYNEYRLITAINGSTITLNAPLTNSYSSAWPLADIGAIGGFDDGGPASIYLMEPSWNVNLTALGFSVLLPNNQIIVTGRDVSVYDSVIFNYAPSASIYNRLFSSNIVGSEIDKDIELLAIVQSKFNNNVTIQSSSIAKLVLYNVNGVLLGTALNNEIYGGNLTANLGPIAFGVTSTITADGANIPVALALPGPLLAAAGFSFNAGTLSLPNSARLWQWGVPGHKYYFSDSDGTNNAIPTTFFTIGAITQDINNTYFTMTNCSWGSCSGALPTPVCNTHSCPMYTPYTALTITQKFTGPANLVPFQAP